MGERFANYNPDKGFVSKIYEELVRSICTHTHTHAPQNNPIKKWAKDLKGHFYKRTYERPTDTQKMFNITSQ